jgi:hypothetical protein
MAATRLMAFADQGRLIFDEPGRLAGILAKHQGQRLRVTLEKPPSLRSLQQNKKLWAMYREALLGMEDYSGHSETEVHEALKVLHCPEKRVILPGGEEVVVRSTKLLTKEEFAAYLEKCMATFASYGVVVS